MAPAGQDGVVYSATYSNVPVFELNVNGNHVMRRRADDWINATHILKVADLDKPARTRVLEKEVQLDIHEKVQGGYGKYQGTWVPQDKAEVLARKYNVYHLLKPILLFKLGAGDKSPPPAPKHTTAASNKARAPKAAPKRVAAVAREEDYEQYDNISEQLHDDDSPDNTTIASESVLDEEYGARKRKRESQYETSRADQEHRMWADALLDYFMLYEGDGAPSKHSFPDIPHSVNVNKPIDDEGHTALHWAAAMGDVPVVTELCNRDASIDSRNIRGETPLIRAALFANCYDRGTWSTMLRIFKPTLAIKDNHGGTIIHHIAYTCMGGSRTPRAKHYLGMILMTLWETLPQPEFFNLLNAQDRAGDTAFHIAVRHSRRCTKLFQSYGLPTNIQNNNGETVDSFLNQRIKSRGPGLQNPLQSSSPIQAESLPASAAAANGISPMRSAPPPSSNNFFLPSSNLLTSSAKSFSRSLTALMSTGFTDFVQSGEAELKDRESVLKDTERALQQKESEVSVKRAKALELQAALERDSLGPRPGSASVSNGNGIVNGGGAGGSGSSDLEAKERALRLEGEKLEEQVQHRALHKLLRQEEDSPLTLAAKERDDRMDRAEERRRKLELARLIDRLQADRVRMTRDIVEAGADAGMGPKGDLMKGIIVQTMAVKPETFVEDVEAMVEHMEVEKAGGTPGLGAALGIDISVP